MFKGEKDISISDYSFNNVDRKAYLITEIQEMLLNFIPVNDIKFNILNRKTSGRRSKNISEKEFQIFFRLALNRISEDLNYTKEFYLQQTIYRYELEVKKLIDEEEEDNKPYAYSMCLEMMKDTESLLGFREPQFRVKINNIIINRESQLKEIQTEDLSVLSLKEKVEFLSLLERSKRSDLELESIKITDKSKEAMEIEEISQESKNSNFKKIRVLDSTDKIERDSNNLLVDITRNLKDKSINNG